MVQRRPSVGPAHSVAPLEGQSCAVFLCFCESVCGLWQLCGATVPIAHDAHAKCECECEVMAVVVVVQAKLCFGELMGKETSRS